MQMELTDDDDDTFYYEVEKILEMQVDGNTRWFYIKWKNYDNSYQNTWEPEYNLSCPEVLEEFLKQDKSSKQSISSKHYDDDDDPMSMDDDHLLYVKSMDKHNAGPAKSNKLASSSSQLKKESIYQIQRKVPVQKPVNIVDVFDLADQIRSGEAQRALSLSTTSPLQHKRTANSPIGSPQYAKHSSFNSPSSSPVLSNQSLPSKHDSRNNNNARSISYDQTDSALGPRGRPRLPVSRTLPMAQGIKRQLSNTRDPRLNNKLVQSQPPQQQQASVNTSWERKLYTHDKLISKIKLEPGNNLLHLHALKKFFTALNASSEPDRISLSAFLPLKRFEDVIKSRATGMIYVTEVANLVEMSKLRSLMVANGSVGIIYNPGSNQEALVLLPPSPAIRVLLDPTEKRSSPLYATYIVDLPKRPDFSHLTYKEEEMEKMANNHYLTWNKASMFLKLPQKLIDLMATSKVLVYGHSELSSLLTHATESLGNLDNKRSQPNTYVMMFNRYNKTIFSRPLKKHKKEYSTKIWEFGVPDLSYAEMIPAGEVFPKNSGGFVMTDVANIIANPDIIDIIISQVRKFNRNSVVYGEWQFILSSSITSDMKKAATTQADAMRAKTAAILLSVALSKGDIQIMRLWSNKDELEYNALQYIHFVAENHYMTKQFFVYVDDIGSVPQEMKDQQHSTDFIKSSRLFSAFT
ncbi:hypothetical protein K501DRAFT_334427 [Backusella circina FSU 941]|nr:hypothetical protein K501DRAFT_334427 [Backusella circina FSU 941]